MKKSWIKPLAAATLLLIGLMGVMLFAAIDASNTPGMGNPQAFTWYGKTSWAVNGSDNDAQAGEVLVAAPGSGSHLYLQYVMMSAAANDTITILEGSDTLIGPITLNVVGTSVVTMDFGKVGLQLADNNSLSFSTAGAATSVTVFAKGYTQ